MSAPDHESAFDHLQSDLRRDVPGPERRWGPLQSAVAIMAVEAALILVAVIAWLAVA